MITLEDYAGPYLHHEDFTPERQDAALGLLDRVNDVIALAIADGVQMQRNPVTGTLVSGSGNGGYRPQDCPIGAPKSKHKRAHGVDVYDPQPDRAFTRWCYAHPEILREHGLCMEDARWTPGWLHFQDIPPGPPGSPWRLDFIPDSTPPKVPKLPEQP